ncbi:Oidioi.mRNA.OKI2018_I69.chr1.g3776.t1.cds [Oikopleura dioica]|uniref:Oidioi.mRNA.OKI2018_I69.chr1.g3776.t1.cds n=1 Tax=Oikopleura dioica TaxID=34765 RepID=A0ABN7T1Q7_OIKDI|nr:Oidioi.mRNA.OKI2018_I69.chr1.g3776.t1.cds [Oikopleura dioica]
MNLSIFDHFSRESLSFASERKNETCTDLDLGEICSGECESSLLSCLSNCSSNDASCESGCVREGFDCIDGCPCHTDCILGCENCSADICNACAFPEENEDHVKCLAEFERELIECIQNCGGNSSCVSLCTVQYSQDILNCPCEEGCPDGCPCPNFDCGDNAEEANSVLIMHYSQKNLSLVNFNSYTEDLFQNLTMAQMIDDLTAMRDVQCFTKGKTIYSEDEKSSYDGSKILERDFPRPAVYHQYIGGQIPVYKDYPILIGGKTEHGSATNFVERYSPSDGWILDQKIAFPEAETYCYSAVWGDFGVVIFPGFSSSKNKIWRLYDDEWTNIGITKWNDRPYARAVLLSNYEVLVLGGEDRQKFTKFSFNENFTSIEGEDLDNLPSLSSWDDPYAILVPNGYCML